jgi:tetrahydromethanopterin S-methyltransferase subunit C
MMTFIVNNLGTIVVGVIVAAIVGLVVAKLVRDKRRGKHVGCDSCAGCDGCRQDNE